MIQFEFFTYFEFLSLVTKLDCVFFFSRSKGLHYSLVSDFIGSLHYSLLYGNIHIPWTVFEKKNETKQNTYNN